MTLAAAFATIAQGFSSALGAPFVSAKILSDDDVDTDLGGSVIASDADPVERTCTVQVDVCTETMRAEEGYTDKDIRILILADTLSGVVTTDQRVQILEGDHAGTWSVQSADRDTASIGWELRGRRT